MKFLVLLPLLVFISCGQKKNDLKLYPVSEEKFARFINQQPMQKDVNLTVVKTLVNNQYPVEVALYSDHKFFYNLPRLGSGTGTWKFEDGRLELDTKRKILNMNVKMNYKIQARDPEAEKVIIHFEDRFGVNMLDATEMNIH